MMALGCLEKERTEVLMAVASTVMEHLGAGWSETAPVEVPLAEEVALEPWAVKLQ